MFRALILAATNLLASANPQVEQTLSIIKPEAVEHGHIGDIEAYFESEGLRVIGAKLSHLSTEQAKEFYSEHKECAFYPELVAYMTSGPVLVQVLEGEDAVAENRKIMGATDPKKASAGTIRADFGTDIQQNAVHGSDSLKNAEKEIAFFFSAEELYPKD